MTAPDLQQPRLTFRNGLSQDTETLSPLLFHPWLILKSAAISSISLALYTDTTFPELTALLFM